LGLSLPQLRKKALDYAIQAMEASKAGQFVTSVFSFSVSALCLSVLVRIDKGKRKATEELMLLINVGELNGRRM